MPLDRNRALEAVFDALPSAVFVVNREVEILAHNPAARRLAVSNPDEIVRRLCGEVLHCFHEAHSPNRCGGTRACALCTLRNAMVTSMETGAGVRKRALLRVQENGAVRKAYFQVTAAPLRIAEGHFGMLVLDGFHPSDLGSPMITMCSNCREVRLEDRNWQPLEAYLRRHTTTRFTHSICPDCLDALYPGMSFDEPS